MTGISRRAVLASAVAGAAVAGVGSRGAHAGPSGVVIATAGRPAAVIAHLEAGDGQVEHSAQEIATYLRKVSGATFEVVTRDELDAVRQAHPDLVVIEVGYIGDEAHPDATADLAATANDQGFVIAAHGSTVTIAGRSPHGTRFGSYEFLEHHLGITWLLPAAEVDGASIGEDVPTSTDISIPEGILSDAPILESRAVSPLVHNLYQEWTRTAPSEVFGARFRAIERQKHHHVLGSIFTPVLYRDTHPELFPIYDGQRYIPTSATLSGWQPRLTPPAAVDAAVDYTVDYLNRYPQFRGYSLSPNDDGAFSDDEFDHSIRNSVGALHVSEVYFHWVNQVAERMAAIRPEATCGVYAYVDTWDPPSFELHPNVKIFICQERYVTVDPVLREHLRDHRRSWEQVAHHVETYDYLYGNSYSAPRMFLSRIEQNYREITENGTQHMYGELHPGWGEGPKSWVIGKLLWNPQRSAERLTREWCQAAVGQRAAAHLDSYYRSWERIWEREIPKSSWFDQSPRPEMYQCFFPFQDPSYLEGVPLAELPRMKQCMDRVVTLAETPEQQARARSMALAAEYYDATAHSYPRRTETPNTAADASALVSAELAAIEPRLAAVERRDNAVVQFAQDPVLVNNPSDPRLRMHAWSGINYQPAWDVAQFISSGATGADAVRAEVSSAAEGEGAPADWAQTLLAIADGQLVMRGENMSFDAADMEPWQPTQAGGRFISDLTREPFAQTDELTVGDGKSVKVSGGARRMIPSQNIIGLTGGFYRFSVRLHTVGEVDPAGYAFIQVIGRNAAGATTLSRRSPQILLADTLNHWYELALTDHFPIGTVSANIQISIQALAWEATTYVDDARFVQLAAP